MQYNEETLSTWALNVLKKIAPKSSIKYAEEVKTWDGIDEFGPEIIIYDFYVIIDKTKEAGQAGELYEYHYYHMEYYTNVLDGPTEYHLEKIEYHNKIAHELFTS